MFYARHVGNALSWLRQRNAGRRSSKQKRALRSVATRTGENKKC